MGFQRVTQKWVGSHLESLFLPLDLPLALFDVPLAKGAFPYVIQGFHNPFPTGRSLVPADQSEPSDDA